MKFYMKYSSSPKEASNTLVHTLKIYLWKIAETPDGILIAKAFFFFFSFLF
jgi:hypothetical protein